MSELEWWRPPLYREALEKPELTLGDVAVVSSERPQSLASGRGVLNLYVGDNPVMSLMDKKLARGQLDIFESLEDTEYFSQLFSLASHVNYHGRDLRSSHLTNRATEFTETLGDIVVLASPDKYPLAMKDILGAAIGDDQGIFTMFTTGTLAGFLQIQGAGSIKLRKHVPEVAQCHDTYREQLTTDISGNILKLVEEIEELDLPNPHVWNRDRALLVATAKAIHTPVGEPSPFIDEYAAMLRGSYADERVWAAAQNTPSRG